MSSLVFFILQAPLIKWLFPSLGFVLLRIQPPSSLAGAGGPRHTTALRRPLGLRDANICRLGIHSQHNNTKVVLFTDITRAFRSGFLYAPLSRPLGIFKTLAAAASLSLWRKMAARDRHGERRALFVRLTSRRAPVERQRTGPLRRTQHWRRQKYWTDAAQWVCSGAESLRIPGSHATPP